MRSPVNGLRSRADLVLLWDHLDAAARGQAAQAIGLSQLHARTDAKEPTRRRVDEPDEDPAKLELPTADPQPTTRVANLPLAPVPLWQPDYYQPSKPEESPVDEPRLTLEEFSPESRGRFPHPPLIPWPRLWPRLARALCPKARTTSLDVDRMVRAIARGEILTRPPRRLRRRLPSRLWIITDRRRRLGPVWCDQDELRWRLRKLLGDARVHLWTLPDGPNGQKWIRGRDSRVGEHQPPSDTPVLYLGDLGAYGTDREKRQWLQDGTRLRERGHPVHALIPAPRERWPAGVERIFSPLVWDRQDVERVEGLDVHELNRRAERLIRLGWFTVRVSPSLLRALRLLLPPQHADIGTEIDVWSHPAVGVPDSSGFTVWFGEDTAAEKTEEVIEQWADRWAKENDRELLDRALKVVERSRRVLHRDFLALERLVLGDYESRVGRAEDERWVSQAQLEEARAFLGRAARSQEIGVGSWFRYTTLRLGVGIYDRHPALLPGYEKNCSDMIELGIPNGAVLQRISIPPAFAGTWQILCQQVSWSLRPYQPEPEENAAPPNCATPLLIATTERAVTVTTGPGHKAAALAPAEVDAPRVLVPSPREVWLSQRHLPGPDRSWASADGQDQYGAWASVRVGGETIRFRWIPPGRFLMGSPETEHKRASEETLHEVELTRGYWLAETACTQSLWEHVMGDNPSHFKGASRPVERVCFDDVIRFVERTNQGAKGLDVRLPTEAEWERACRAGTTAPFSFGEDITTDQVNYDGELPYREKKGKYRRETVDVGSLPPNSWGLFEMHGNVLEWCSDVFGPYPDGVVQDPEGPKQGSERVVRGGSWFDHARYCRSAQRDAIPPGSRDDSLGVRLARGSGSSAAGKGGAVVRPGSWERGGGPDEADPGSRSRVRVITEKGAWTVRAITKPSWASASGRDEFGLWADLDFEGVIQRMRWIPPGEFTQGSRKSEAGRLPNETVREVVLTRGYWLADTPCTQQLWTAAMGKQPSRFRSPTRPVEQVGFQDVQAFLERLRSNAGLEFRLPREAEWEAACRAGTLTATYAGDLVIHGQRNAPQLDAIAWYGGNSGVDFDLEDGHDTKDWNEMQYPTAQAGTRRVKLKRPNAHGIYDMLGNVWEWCNDWYEEYGPSPVIDPAGPEQGSERVVRGGSWFSRARICRSAQRNAFPPEFRYHYLGFRLARGPEGKESETGAHKAPLRTQARDAPGSKRARPWRSKKGRGNKKR